jgi:hypothetical protein
MYFESAGEAEILLINGFGGSAVTESMNFYVENNPWSVDDEYALAIKRNALLYVYSDRVGMEEFVVNRAVIFYDRCPGLHDAALALRSKWDLYDQDSELEQKESFNVLDGPSITLKEFGATEGFLVRERKYLSGSQLSTLGANIIKVASQCL